MPIKINGETTGSVTLAAPATGSDVTLTLPGSSVDLAAIPQANVASLTSDLASKLTTPGAWTAYTPSFSGLTVGNGTFVNCAFVQIGKFVSCRVGFIWGSTTAITSVVDFSLPVTAKAVSGNPNFGVARYIDATGSQYNGVVVYISSSALRFQRSYVSGSEILAGEVGGASPFTWTTNDQMHAVFQYEAA